MALPTRAERAMTALRNGESRAAKHVAEGKFHRAAQTMLDASATAKSWLDGSHPLIERAS